MFIDYLTLIMINLVAGTALLAYYIYAGMDAKDQRPYAAAFGIVGLLAVILGLYSFVHLAATRELQHRIWRSHHLIRRCFPRHRRCLESRLGPAARGHLWLLRRSGCHYCWHSDHFSRLDQGTNCFRHRLHHGRSGWRTGCPRP